MHTLLNIFNLDLPVRKVIRLERDINNYLRKYVFEKAYKLHCSWIRGLPDFLVIKAKYGLPAGFYEIKKWNNTLSKWQVAMMSELSISFNCIVVQYNKKEHCLQFYKFSKNGA